MSAIVEPLYNVGDRLEATIEEKGFEDSYWTCTVREVIDNGSQYVIEFEQLKDDNDENKGIVETVPPSRVRPIPPDDSDLIPPYFREPGEAVDVWDCDGWWEAYVSEVWDDRIAVTFPASLQTYYDIGWPDARRVRTGRDYFPETMVFRRRRKKLGVDHRSEAVKAMVADAKESQKALFSPGSASEVGKEANTNVAIANLIPRKRIIASKTKKWLAMKMQQTSPDGVGKPYRHRPGTTALKEIREYPKLKRYSVLRKPPFNHLVKDIIDLVMATPFAWTADALEAVPSATEAYVLGLIEKVQSNTLHIESNRGKQTTETKQLARRIRGGSTPLAD